MKFLIIILISFLITGCQGKIYEDNNVDYFKIKDNNIDVYSKVFINDIIINNSDYKIISDNYQIDTNKLGVKEYSINYLKNNKNYVYKFKLNIVDQEPPLVFSGTSKTVNIGYDGDLCNLITYGDNYSGNVKCEIKGEVDLNKEGKYQLEYYLSDSSKNVKKVNVTLNVKDNSKNNGNNNGSSVKKKTLFSDILENYKDNNNLIGIDISKWQGEVDFHKVKNAGAKFVMIRIGYQNGINGEIIMDPYFKENIKKAKDENLLVGVYFNSQAKDIKESLNQAKWVINNLDKEKLDLPIAFDWENWSKWNNFKISFHEINEIARAFIKKIESNGYTGMMYGSKFYLETIWEDFANVWLAHYTEKTTYKGDYLIWQLANDGQIDGINGDVDIDILFK